MDIGSDEKVLNTPVREVIPSAIALPQLSLFQLTLRYFILVAISVFLSDV